MTAQEYMAGAVERTARMLAYTLQHTHEDRIVWEADAGAGGTGRSAIDQAQECIGVNRRIAAVLSGQTPQPPAEPDLTMSAATAQEQLMRSARELASVIRGLDDEAFTRTVHTPFAAMPACRLCEIGLMNTSYHVGQVNFIQLLYGDKEFRVPPEFMNPD